MVVLRERMDEVAAFIAKELTILAKTALAGGISPFVFVVYTNSIGTVLLLPFSFLFHHRERTEQSLFTFPLLVRIFFLGLTGIALSQNLAFLGLSYSSPNFVCATGLQIPSISFLLSIIFRTTRLDWRSSSSRAKVVGTLISIMGAVVVELYKGPFIRKSYFFYAYQLKVVPKLFVFYSTPNRWILCGILLAAASLSVSIWNIIQLGTVKKYPQVMKVASFYSLAGTIQCLLFSLFMEIDLNDWKLKHKRDLILIVVTGVFGSIIRSNVHLACTRMKGPFYVPMFKPFGIDSLCNIFLVSASLQTVFIMEGNANYDYLVYHLNLPSYWYKTFYSVIGTLIIGMGYYTVIWRQKREEELCTKRDVEKLDNTSDLKAPFLQENKEAQV